jgi:hypothetical protein
MQRVAENAWVSTEDDAFHLPILPQVLFELGMNVLPLLLLRKILGKL